MSRNAINWVLSVCSLALLGTCLEVHRWTNKQEAVGARLEARHAEQSVPLRRELIRLESRLESLQEYFVEAEETEQEARFLAGLPMDENHPIVPHQVVLWPHDHSNDRDLQLLISTTASITHIGKKAQHTKSSYADIAGSMLEQAPAWAGVPSIAPVREARQTSDFGRRRDPFTGERAHHYGIDLAADYGSAVYASASGRVRLAGWLKGYGRFVEIDHGNGIRTRYGHNSKILVRAGEQVRRGQVIARLGKSGRANAPHLHYEVLVDGRQRNPGYVSGAPVLAEE